MDYFKIATGIARNHEAKRQAAKPCQCAHYPFPHRRDDRCDDYLAEAQDVAYEMSSRDRDAQMLRDFDATEAAAINAERRS